MMDRLAFSLSRVLPAPGVHENNADVAGMDLFRILTNPIAAVSIVMGSVKAGSLMAPLMVPSLPVLKLATSLPPLSG